MYRGRKPTSELSCFVISRGKWDIQLTWIGVDMVHIKLYKTMICKCLCFAYDFWFRWINLLFTNRKQTLSTKKLHIDVQKNKNNYNNQQMASQQHHPSACIIFWWRQLWNTWHKKPNYCQVYLPNVNTVLHRASSCGQSTIYLEMNISAYTTTRSLSNKPPGI